MISRKPDVILTMVGEPEVRYPENMPPPPPPPVDGENSEGVPMPALPVYDAVYFGVKDCSLDSSVQSELCDAANPSQFALRRPVEGKDSICTCHDPFTGQMTGWNRPCSESCPSEAGKTCKEKRDADLRMLEDAQNNGHYIGKNTKVKLTFYRQSYYRYGFLFIFHI